MERRAFLKASLTSLGLPEMIGPEASVQWKRTSDTGRVPIQSVTLAGMQLDAEADDLPTMYNPQLVAVIEVANVMVARQETPDPESDVMLTFSRYEDGGRVVRRVHRVAVPVRNLRAGLYLRGPVHYRLRMSVPVPGAGLRFSVRFDRAARVIVCTDEIYGTERRTNPTWIGNTVLVARPLSTV
jgi:hypothetical protein